MSSLVPQRHTFVAAQPPTPEPSFTLHPRPSLSSPCFVPRQPSPLFIVEEVGTHLRRRDLYSELLAKAPPSRNVLNGRHGMASLFISTSGPAITTYDGGSSCGREFESTSKTERQFRRQSTSPCSREMWRAIGEISVASVYIGVNPGKSRKRNYFRINVF